jgi:CBS domain-containing protein
MSTQASRQRLGAPPETVDDDPPVTALMTRDLVGVTPDTPVMTALSLMATRRVRHLPVLAGRGCLGLVIELDLVRALAAVPLPLGLAGPLVADLVRPVGAVSGTARRSEAADVMSAGTADAVLVVDREHLLGIVTATDLVRSLSRQAPAEPR